MTDHTPLTDTQLDEYAVLAKAAIGSWGIYEHFNDGSVTDIADEVCRLRQQLADAWVPCSPAWLAAHPGQCPGAPRVAGPEGVSHLHPAALASPASDASGAPVRASEAAPGPETPEAPPQARTEPSTGAEPAV